MTAAPSWPAVGRTVALSVVLLATSAVLYADLVQHVLDRGDDIVQESVRSASARQPLQLAGTGLLCAAASGLLSFHPAVRGRRFAPLLGIGLAALPAGLVGATAFSVGRTAFVLAGAVAAPSLVTLLLACAVRPRPHPGLLRFIARSWMATGFLLGLVLLAMFGLELAEIARPRVPWASVFAALAIGTLLQLAARYVGMHGARLSALAQNHQQERGAHETDAIRAVANRLHPFIEEGRDPDGYAALARELGAAAGQPAVASTEVPAGSTALPTPAAGGAALLRALAVAIPLLPLVPRLGGPVALLAFALLLPWMRRTLAPAGDRLPRTWWLVGALGMAGAGAWAGTQLTAPGLARLTAPLAVACALPYLALFAASYRRTATPSSIAHARLTHATRMAQTWRRSAGRGLAVAGLALLLPLGTWLASRMTGIPIEAPSWFLLVGLAASGLLWAAAAALAGPAAKGHRQQLAALQAAQRRARSEAHRLFLDRLEMT